MSIQPIDLQTLFMHLGQVGKEQSAIKQAIIQNQEVVGREIAEASQQAERSVRETEEVSEGPETVKEDGQQNPRRRRGDEASESQTPEEPDGDAFQDPDLGRNVDLTG
jgi:hypothetical protein